MQQNASKLGMIALGAQILSQLITGTTYAVAKVALAEFSPFCLAFWRFLGAAFAYVIILGYFGELKFPDKKDSSKLILLALLGVPINQGLFLVGIQKAPAAHGALLYAATPMVVFVLSCFINRLRPVYLKVIGITIGFLGVFMILLEKGLVFSSKTLVGDAIIAAAVLSWALYLLLSKSMMPKYSPLYLTGMSMILGGIVFVPIGLNSALVQDYNVITLRGVLALGYLTLLTSVVAYLVCNWALKYLSAEKVAIVSNLQPVIAAVTGQIMLGEKITFYFCLGTVFVFAGVALTQKSVD